MKKFILILTSIVLGLFCFSLFGCGNKNTLKVYNCYDYIDKKLIKSFEKYYKEQTGTAVKVKYSCFDTPEDAYNNLKIDPRAYDLVCPSDYMIEKMAKENMLQKFTMDSNGVYMKNVSPYINSMFESISWEAGSDGAVSWEAGSLSEYAVGYMWGTLGLVYNPANVNKSDMESWSVLWNKYSGQFSIKDSVRDTYFIALAKYYETELLTAKSNYETDKNLDEYKSLLKQYFNDTKPETVNNVKDILVDLGNKCKNLEVDEGKEEITKGNIDINFAWSGDAVYALDLADKNDLKLEYYVPNEGSNIWFDGWVIPKDSEKADVAKMFLDFISMPENVIKNMDYIGYTSVVAGEEVFNYVKDKYDKNEGKETDLSYFFGEGNYVIKNNEERRQFYTQYPPEEVVNRCVCMS
ncbi:MAG: extracellular solute-binding protein, partial [Clostridia bacterium]|nr:extracellular solute-binding protein [Clostridia bacterium]